MRRALTILVTVAVGLTVIGPTPVSGQSQVTLTVSVVTDDGAPVGGATINATWDDGGTTATTASNGKAFVDVPEGADVLIDIEHDRYIRNNPLVVENADERDVTVTVSRKGQATVVVTRGEEPIEGASVEFRDGRETVVEGETDADGVYETGVIERGTYTVRTLKSGYYSSTEQVTVGAGTETTVELERGEVQLRVSVVDDFFEEPRSLDGASVSVRGGGASWSVDSARDGSTSFTVPVNTWYTVTVSMDGYQETSDQQYVRESDRRIELETQRIPSLSIEPANRRVVVGETVRVTVRNAYDEPAEGVTVLRDGEAVGETDANGEYVVAIEDRGEHTLVAQQGDLEASVTVEGVAPGQGDATPTEPPEDSSIGLPAVDGSGFGLAGAVLGVLISVLLLRRHG